MKHAFYKSIKGRFLIISAILVLVIGIGTSTLGYIMFSQNLRDNQVHATETNLQFLKNNIDSGMEDIISLCEWSTRNSGIIDFIMTSKEDSSYNTITKNASERLNEECQRFSNQYIDRLVVANTQRDDFLQIVPAEYSVGKSLVDIIKKLPYYEELLSLGKSEDYTFSMGVQQDPFLRKDLEMLPLIRPIEHPYNSSVVGFTYIQVSPDLFTDPLKDFTKQEELPAYVTIGDETYEIQGNKITSASDLKYTAKALNYSSDINRGTLVQSVKVPGESRLFVTMPLDTQDCYLSLPISNDAFHQQLQGYFVLLFFILTVILVLGFTLMFTLNHQVTKPVNALRSRIDCIAGGDFTQDSSIEWDNELGDIGKNINQLATDIQKLMEQRIHDEKQKKDYEYRVLQSQINPHFLYNTLNSIKWMATIQSATGIAEMTTSLAHLLKSIAKGTTTIVSLEQEIELLNDYFTIQKYRYGGAITLEYSIDQAELLKVQILRFTLQPIVENAIFHGIEPKGQNGSITIHIYRVPNAVQIDVTDDGVGMEPHSIEKVLKDESSDRSHFFRQIGISSVNKRIKYNFGEQYGMSITSIPGKYTTMSILLPEIYIEDKGENEDD